MSAGGVALRPAVPGDAGAILRLIRALAEYERLLAEVVADEAGIAAALFGPEACAEALLAEQGGAVVGFALWFYSFSTFTGRRGIHIEDVFVEPAERRRGIGLALFRAVAARAVREGCARLEWTVLDWNRPAVEFYRRLGAEAMDGWTVQRLSGPALHALAAQGD